MEANKTVEALVLKYQPLARGAVARYRNYRHHDPAQVESNVMFALLRAAQTFNPKKANFITWFNWWVKAYALRRNRDEIRHANAIIHEIDDPELHTAALQTEHTPETQLQKWGEEDIYPHALATYREVRRRPGHEARARTYAYVLYQYYQFERTLEEIGKDLSVSRERIRQIRDRAQQTLETFLKKDERPPLRKNGPAITLQWVLDAIQ